MKKENILEIIIFVVFPICAVLGFVLFICLDIYKSSSMRDEFISDCIKYKPKYECISLSKRM